ncbi:alpha-amylase [Aquimarina sp. RZ0]|uniref:alpha-amylase n=1 Tax=Aquimarina sp. RZ0 TaxID=2607730 RepID=UPI0011F2036C|nr:alpha-amylase [Aquimarina sp. RZ0]KAA1248110.1 alpha-amylase [Aquimarina sp. RZ0]
MKNIKNITIQVILLFGFITFSLQGCSDDDSTNQQEPVEDLKLDLSQFTKADAGVMMQAFYWDVEPRGAWYDEVRSKIDDWATSGVNRIWLAPPGKGASGEFSMGYDPSDYFDVGEFDQHGTVETRFGSRAELESLIQKSHDNNIEVIADIVMGHNSGGGKQDNPFRPGDTEVYSLFNELNGNASGKFNRSYEHFHPNDIHTNDEEALFFEKTDLCHDQQYVQDWLWGRDDSVAEFYKNSLGFDGWRFDYVKSFDPKFVTAWNDKVGGFSVGENFDGNQQVLKDWVNASGIPAFDFACFYRLDETLDRANDLTALGTPENMLRKLDPANAVTFTANHDTEKDENPDNRISYANKLLAYSYILTHDGYPTIFYLDYENESFKEPIKKLITIYNTIADGDIEIIIASEDEYIMKRNGNGDNPGLILYMNISNRTKQFEVTSNWANKTLIDYTDNSAATPTADNEGKVIIQAPGKSFSVWSIAKE